MSRPDYGVFWRSRLAAQRVTPQYPDLHQFTYEPDPLGDWRVSAEGVDGVWFDYAYDQNGCLTSRARRAS